MKHLELMTISAIALLMIVSIVSISIATTPTDAEFDRFTSQEMTQSYGGYQATHVSDW